MCSSFDDVSLGGKKKAALELFASECCLAFQNSMIPSGLSWEDLLHPLYQKYKNHITWGDQDLLNIIFHYNPGTVLSTGVLTPSAIIITYYYHTENTLFIPRKRLYDKIR